MAQCIILSSAYMPPVFYMMCIARHSDIRIEACEYYQKQTFRNRALIKDAQGFHHLNIPIKHQSENLPIREACIDFKHAWQKQHIGALQAAYGQLPYFEFYADEYFYCIRHAPQHLFEFNLRLTEMLCNDMNLIYKPTFTSEYFKESPCEIDLRQTLHPKKDIPFIPGISVEQSIHGIENFKISAIEMLFTYGPECWKYLE